MKNLIFIFLVFTTPALSPSFLINQGNDFLIDEKNNKLFKEILYGK